MFLSRFVPKISIGPDPLSDFSVSLEHNTDNKTTEEVLQLPEIIAKEKGIKTVVCIDEFLKKISEADWCEYICRKFTNSGKSISPELAGKICEITDRYSSYVQQLAWFVWLRTDGPATEDDLKYGMNRLLDACEPVFIQQTESLSSYQMNFLRVLADGIHTGFTQSSILNTYRLGTPANISRLKKSLTEKDLIAITAPHTIEITDPILKLWLKKRVWNE